MTNLMPRPGWYSDPDGTGGLRYFDGTNWTAQFAAPPPSIVINNTNAVAAAHGPNHGLHLVLTLLTCGAWLPVWVIVALVSGASRVRVAGGHPVGGGSGTAWRVVGGIVGGLFLLGLVGEHPLLLVPLVVLAGVGYLGYREYQRTVERRTEQARLAARAEAENDAIRFGDPSGFYGQYPPAPLPPDNRL